MFNGWLLVAHYLIRGFWCF